MAKYINNPVLLDFNPNEISPNSNLRKVFDDYVARTFWLGLSCNHVRGYYFNKNCLKIAKKIEKNGVPTSPSELLNLLDRCYRFPSYGIEFATELFPYINGESRLEFIVKSKVKSLLESIKNSGRFDKIHTGIPDRKISTYFKYAAERDYIELIEVTPKSGPDFRVTDNGLKFLES